MKKIILCGLVGAVVAQIWGTISWMVLPWHNLDFKQFTDDTIVTDAVRSQLQGSGLYTLPNMDPECHTDEAKREAFQAKAKTGPFVFMSVRADGINPGMALPMGVGFGLNFFIAAVLIWLAGKTTIDCPKGKTLFIAIAGSLGALYPHISNWSWWHFPIIYCVVGVVDLFITWGLAGFAMIKLQSKLK